MNALYTAVATATGGRNGHVKSSDGIVDFQLHVPGAMGGPGGEFTNPEQLFAAGYAACFDGALNLAAKLKHVKTGETTVTASVSIGKNDSGGFQLAVRLDVDVPGVTQDVADSLVEDAHRICPYSNATRGNIEVLLYATTGKPTGK